MKFTLITGANIVNEGKIFTGSILLAPPLISEIYEKDVPSSLLRKSEIIDASGKYLFPGIIDTHVHFREPGLIHKGDLYSESKAAVAGGVTSVLDMPNTLPQTITNDLLRKKQELAAGKSFANYSFYLGATNENIAQIRNADPATTCGIKVFMGASTGGMLVDNVNVLEKIFSDSPLRVAAHCEDEKIIRNNLSIYNNKYGENIPFSCHPLIRSREACMASSSLAISLAEKYGTRLHLLHLSTEDELRNLAPGLPPEKKKITAEA
jgi:dihydroorotase